MELGDVPLALDGGEIRIHPVADRQFGTLEVSYVDPKTQFRNTSDLIVGETRVLTVWPGQVQLTVTAKNDDGKVLLTRAFAIDVAKGGVHEVEVDLSD